MPDPPSRPRLSVVVPSWNGRRFLAVLLPSLAAQTLAAHEVIVVDNGSRDGTVGWLAAAWPGVRVVVEPENTGFARAVNLGIAAARGADIVLVNNDVELDPGFLAALAQALDANPRAGSVAAKMVDYHRRERLDGAGDALYWSGAALQRGKGEPDDARWAQPCEVFSACGGAAAYRRSALASVGPFDEWFFAYQEDVDWGFRARLAGWGCVYEPRAVAFHMGSASTARPGRPHPLPYRLNRRNHLALVLKNWPARLLVRSLPLVAAHQARELLVSARIGMGGVHLRALAEAAAGLPRLLRARRAIQGARVATDAELAAVAEPRAAAWRLVLTPAARRR